MPYIAEIVEMLNSDLQSGKLTDGKRFTNQLNGLSELQPVNESDQRTVPILVSQRDFSTFAGFDDRYSFQCYHRIIGIQNEESPLSYGDGATNGREVAQMRMVVFADKQRTRLNQYDLGFMVRSSLNKQYLGDALLPYNGLLGVTVETTEDNYNGIEIWQQEYSFDANAYPVRMHQCLFTIDYNITTDYNNECITSCLEC